MEINFEVFIGKVHLYMDFYSAVFAKLCDLEFKLKTYRFLMFVVQNTVKNTSLNIQKELV